MSWDHIQCHLRTASYSWCLAMGLAPPDGHLAAPDQQLVEGLLRGQLGGGPLGELDKCTT